MSKIIFVDSVEVALVKAEFPEGTKIKAINSTRGVPENTIGVVDFVDDAGVIFVETPGSIPNFSFCKCELGKNFIRI